MLDSVKLGLLIVIIGGLLAISGASIVSWNNTGSRNLALATGTLGAAIVLFLIQLPFELRATEQHDFISIELTLDRSTRVIRQWKYPENISWRIHAEVDASEAVAKERPDLFDGDRDHLTADMVLFSLVSYLASNEFDWQRQTRRFVGATFGTMVTWQRRSKRTECTVVGEPQLRRLLENATNSYAKAPLKLVFGDLCLPPHTNLSLTAQSLTLENTFCKVKFLLEPSGAVSYMQPGTGGEVPTLESGEARLETRVFGLAATTTCAALRAQHPAMAKHRDWAAGLVAGAHQWFEGGEVLRR